LAPARPNLLFITADDMNYDSPGCYGSRTPDITPNIDNLASEGMAFTNAHVTIAVCMPSREVLMTGRYPYRNGGEGFEPIRKDVPTLQEQLHEAGYLNGILGKENHLAPVEKFCWDHLIPMHKLGRGRDPGLYYRYSDQLFRRARKEGRPFFLMANSHDPHRPFAGSDQETQKWGDDRPAFDRAIDPGEVEVPGFLPDIPEVRREIGEYYTSVHRCDETVGMVLQALDDNGLSDETLVMLISDNGMAFPFAKTNCYLNSTKTPWLVRWPGYVREGTVDSVNMISGVDYMPTILEAAGLPAVEGLDGKSMMPLLLGGKQGGREYVFTEFHETAANRRYPMRCVQTPRLGYIINFWSDGGTVFMNESQSGRTFKAMVSAAEDDESIESRVRLFQYRVPEEFYDFAKDPNGLHNLIDDPAYQWEIERLRQALLAKMAGTGDPALAAFRQRSPRAIADFMACQRKKGEDSRIRKMEARARGQSQ
jgi:N-sulfoglucosamine sulfohydrolase